MSYSTSSSLSFDEVKFIASRRINNGFKGWKKLPQLDDTAKEILCKDHAKFKDIYGDYFIVGWKMGSQIKIEVSSKTKSMDTQDAVSASLEASWNGVGTSVEGSASFET